MRKQIRLGILGCGVVGGGVVRALQQNGDWIAKTHGITFNIVRIAVRDLQRDRGGAVRRSWLTDDWQKVTNADDVDVVVEVMGGLTPAYEAVVSALRNGKHVVTANKALLAVRGEDLRQLAKQHGATLLYEASVLGGVPVLHGLTTYFKANRIERLRGIVNGTCNYILSRMDEDGCEFEQALQDAQRLGYAEADPTQDITSLDAMYKLEILVRQAFSVQIPHGEVERSGIQHISMADIDLARQLGCRVQQVAQAERAPDGVHASVGPALVPYGDPLAHVRGADNALCVDADIVGRVTYTGPGAGAFPTASAVVEDLIQMADLFETADIPVQRCAVRKNEAELYFVRRQCDRPKAWLGPLAIGLAAGEQAHIDGYVRTADGRAEGWVLSATREGLAQVTASLTNFDGLPVTWFPFASSPTHKSNRLVSSEPVLDASI